VTLPGGASFNFEIDSFSKKCLLAGIDQIGYILSFEDRISQFEQDRETIIFN